MLSDRVFKMIMLVVLPLTALYVLRGHALSTGKEPYGRVRTTLLSMAIALALGLYDGFYGPGAGTFMLLLLTAGAHLSLAQANGTTKAINLTTNLTALTVFWLNGRVLVPLGLTAGLFGMAGNYMGTRFFEKDGSRAVRPIMLVVLTVFFIRVLSELL